MTGSVTALDVGAERRLTLDEVAARKAFRRLMWYIFVLFSIAYLDRLNLGFAALSMNKELGLSAFSFGIAGTIMYAGYALLEVPSNMILAKVGARRWLARIMVTWGFASMATALATGPYSLYLVRFLVGVAEAGFLPGIVLYLTFWFPRAYRARANALFLVAGAFSLVYSAVSGLILEMDGFLGLSGWRWLFVLEGAPAVVFGVITVFYLTERPADAKWLSPEEREALQARLDSEREAEVKSAGDRGSLWRQLANRNVVLLSLCYFGMTVSFNANGTWSPLIIREFAKGLSFSSIGFIAAIPPLCTVLLMPFWGWRSDRKLERHNHLYRPLLLAVVGWMIVAFSTDPAIRLFGLICSTLGPYCAQPVFWSLPGSAAIFSPEARPVGIALISAIGICGSIVSPLVVGFLKDLTGSFTAGLLFISVMLVVAAACGAAVTGRYKSVL